MKGIKNKLNNPFTKDQFIQGYSNNLKNLPADSMYAMSVNKGGLLFETDDVLLAFEMIGALNKTAEEMPNEEVSSEIRKYFDPKNAELYLIDEIAKIIKPYYKPRYTAKQMVYFLRGILDLVSVSYMKDEFPVV